MNMRMSLVLIVQSATAMLVVLLTAGQIRHMILTTRICAVRIAALTLTYNNPPWLAKHRWSGH
jgi:hypothetical protein